MSLGEDSKGVGERLIKEVHEKEPWRNKAQCRGYSKDLFFPVTPGSPTINFAKSICKKCSVRRECFEFGWITGQLGIWGGTDEWERHKMKGLLGSELPNS